MSAYEDHPLPPEEFDRIYARVPRLTVEVVISSSEGLMLVRRDIEPCRGQWHLPGGTVLFGELLTDAVRRVARSEVGVDVAVGDLLGYIEYPHMLAAGYRGWPVGVAFAATVVGGRVTGSRQGAVIRCFPAVPEGTIAEQAAFLRDRLPAGVRATAEISG